MSGDLFFDLDGHGEPALWQRGNPPTALDARETAQAAGVLLAEVAALRAELAGLRQRVEAAADEIERQVTAFLPDGADHCERAANDAFRLAANIARAALAADSPEPERPTPEWDPDDVTQPPELAGCMDCGGSCGGGPGCKAPKHGGEWWGTPQYEEIRPGPVPSVAPEPEEKP